jgi:hypothetical protein
VSITVHGARQLLLAADRTTLEKYLGAHGPDPAIIEWAEFEGFEIVDHIYENGVAGQTPILLRDHIGDAIRRLRDQPELHGIVWPSIDRLARNALSAEAVAEAVWYLGKHCYTRLYDAYGELGPFQDIADLGTRMERRNVREQLWRSEEARTRLLKEAERARKAKIARFGKGGGRHRPAWFQDEIHLGPSRSEFTPNPHRLQWALWMQDRRAEGWSYLRIAQALAEHDITAKSGKPLGRNRVWEICDQIGRVPENILNAWLAASPDVRPVSLRSSDSPDVTVAG